MAKKKETKEAVQEVEQVQNVQEGNVNEETQQQIRLDDIDANMALRLVKSGLEAGTKGGVFTMEDVTVLNKSIEVLYKAINPEVNGTKPEDAE